MAIEIFILSGSRRGQRLTLDAQRFRAGCDPECEVRFDPQLEPAASERAAVFRLHGDGWYVHRIGGGEILLNHNPVRKPARLRSGDIVRMSESGPDFSFTIVGRTGTTLPWTALPAAPPAAPVLPFQSPAPAANFPVVPPGANATFPVFPAAVTPAASPTGVTLAPSSVTTPAALPAVASWTGWPVIYTVAGVAICACCFLLAKFLFAPPPFVGPGPAASVVPPPVPSSVVSTTSPSAPLPIISPPVTSPPPPGTSAIAAPAAATSAITASTPTPPLPTTPDWPALAEQLKGGVLMVQVSLDTGQTWPLATCWAVGDDAVLTTAAAACDLAKFRQEKFRIWVVDPSSGTKYEVQTIRVPADYQMYAERPVERQFYDIGLLEVRGRLPKKLSLASGKELEELEDGLPLAGFGFSLKAAKITKFDRYEPGLTLTRVFLIKSPPPHAADGPKLLDVTGSFPENVLGSPLIDAQGKIVAIYSKVAPSQDASGMKDLHFAVVASARSIGAWLQDRDAKTWTTLSSPEGSSESAPRP